MHDIFEKNVALRVMKPYAGARNHIYTGQLVYMADGWLAVDGVVFNFGRPTTEDPSGGLTVSPRAVRWLPNERVQYMRQLDDGADPFDPESFVLEADGRLTYRATDRPDLIPD